MGGGDFRPPGAPKPLNRFTWYLAWVIRSTVRQHMQNMVAAENGGWLRIWVKLHPRVFFFIFFGSFNASTAYPEKLGFSLSASKNVFVFRWWVCSFVSICPGGQIFHFFAPRNHFSMGRIRLPFCMGANRKHPLWLMIAP